MNVEDWIGIYGAIVGTVAVVWQIWSTRRDRGRLRLECFIGDSVDPNLCRKVDRGHLVFRITNVGRQPIVASGVGVGLHGTSDVRWILTSNLTKPLAPGEFCGANTPKVAEMLEGARYIIATDTIGTRYRLPRRDFRKLMKTYAEARIKSARVA